ncbi:transposase, partial [Glycomyces tarimensis]
MPDGLWEITAPLIGQHAKRAQGGGIARVEDPTVFTAIVFVLTTGCAWRHLPPTFAVSHQTAIRTPQPPLRRVPRPRRSDHLLQETRQLRHTLSLSFNLLVVRSASLISSLE